MTKRNKHDLTRQINVFLLVPERNNINMQFSWTPDEHMYIFMYIIMIYNNEHMSYTSYRPIHDVTQTL